MRLIDADELNTDIVVKRNALDTSAVVGRGGYIALNKVLTMIEEQPTIDAVPVVRCKGCKYMTEHCDTDGNAPYWTCSEWDSGTDYDGFCHCAERRADG